VKLADFGSASSTAESTITPYLVSRFYRAPEIVMGLQYDFPLDMWSLGCCLYEICTGKILFPGKRNNEMLFLHMEASGPFPKKLIKKGAFGRDHFDEFGNFKRVLTDKLSKKDYIKLINITKPTRDLKEELLSVSADLDSEEKKMVLQLHDLLSRMLILDPVMRITVESALHHPFISGSS